MIPFDRVALLAMLVTFYPEVSRANLELAYRERPEYFAGGVLFGTNGEKLRLGDGRFFDLAYDAWGPRRRWQVHEIVAGEESAPNPFPLEEGLLVPFSMNPVIPTMPGAFASPFVSVVAEGAAQLGAENQLLGTIGGNVAVAAAPEQLADIAGDDIAQLAGAVDAEGSAWSVMDPAGVIERTGGALPGIDQQVQAHPEPQIDTEPLPDPGPPRADREDEPDDDDSDRPGPGRGQ